MPRRTIIAAVLGFCLAVPSAAHAAPDRLPTLTASATLPGSELAQQTRLRLDGYSRETFQLLERPSASTVVLGYPAYETRRVNGKRRRVRATPCARTRLTLTLQPPVADPLAYVREVVPTATTEGQRIDTPFTSPPVAAWRQFGTIENSRTLRVRAVAARQYTRDTVQGLIRLDMQARTLGRRLPCVSTSRFTIGPNLDSVLTLFG